MGRPARRSRLLKRLLWTLTIVLCASIVAVYLIYRHLRANPEAIWRMVPKDATVAMDRIHHTATREGRVEWVLDARSARLDSAGQRLHLEEVRVDFFTSDGRKIRLTADRGTLMTASNDIAVQDHVVVENEDSRLDTRHLKYLHEKRRVVAPSGVRLTRNGSSLAADRMTFHIDEDRAKFSGRVKGTFRAQLDW